MIITLELAAAQQQYFNALREQYFPAHANYLDAHITLFYRLPEQEPAIPAMLTDFARRPPFELLVDQVYSFGPGVAFGLLSPELMALHTAMQAAFQPWLLHRDQQPLRPHITIQNKVTAFKAQQLCSQLQQHFTPFRIAATGIASWRYLKGPWKRLHDYPFYFS
ncbi:2'-5' RNA ligase family protein [Chitinophaga vietnamensis]|uniref:2'-5' RNA ligase family protein n=1 Tax=Chitinophaga vietnamensis TaxID=2593957 RepID=UPI001375D0B3|nr:2'-5' RNA ligase family protein [Chitinophaga vietnamensis]